MADKEEFDFEEIHFLPIPSQTNIYGLTKIDGNDEERKLFLASLSGRVVCLEYPRNSPVPTSKEVPFTYIPDSAEIVSIDTFNRPETRKGLVVGISLILLKNSRSHQKQFLNIYSALESRSEFSLGSIAEGCQHLELNFVPFQLTHAEVVIKERKQIVFLLCGSDEKVHMFCEDKTQQRFEEQPVQSFFPELQNLPSNVLWLEVETLHNSKRVTVVGCQNGHVKVAVTDLTRGSIEKIDTLDRDGPISSVKLFTQDSSKIIEATGTDAKNIENGQTFERRDYHLLVCCAIEATVVYTNIISQGFTNMVILPESDEFDCVTCTCIADVNWDGKNEIILGTYGQELLIFKCVPLDNTGNGSNSIDFQLMWKRSFASPLFAIEYLDLTNDGLKELAVASLSGLHVLQHNLDNAALHSTKQNSPRDSKDVELVT